MWPSEFSLVADLSFSPEYYLATNRDVAEAFGCQNWPFCGDFVGARKHWQEYGIDEGRTQSPFFDPAYYGRMNTDVKTWAKSKADSTGKSVNYWLRYHWVNYGITEGRLASPVFNPKYYLQKYPGVNDAAVNSGDKYKFALQHWAAYGINECRDMTARFNPCTYLDKNDDLAEWTEYNNYGVMNKSRWQARLRAIAHYHENGRFEGRQAI